MRGMDWREVASRINGVGVGLDGVSISWVPATLDRDVARSVIAFLEVRRVLFSPYSWEMPDACVQSAIEIRDFLTGIVGRGGMAAELEAPVRHIRAYCVRFLESVTVSERGVPREGRDRYLHEDPRMRVNDYFFGEALGELRVGVALQAGVIAIRYELDMEDDLARMLPPIG